MPALAPDPHGPPTPDTPRDRARARWRRYAGSPKGKARSARYAATLRARRAAARALLAAVVPWADEVAARGTPLTNADVTALAVRLLAASRGLTLAEGASHHE